MLNSSFWFSLAFKKLCWDSLYIPTCLSLLSRTVLRNVWIAGPKQSVLFNCGSLVQFVRQENQLSNLLNYLTIISFEHMYARRTVNYRDIRKSTEHVLAPLQISTSKMELFIRGTKIIWLTVESFLLLRPGWPFPLCNGLREAYGLQRHVFEVSFPQQTPVQLLPLQHPAQGRLS